MGDQARYIHLKEISVHFINKHAKNAPRLELILGGDGAAVKQGSKKFKQRNLFHWDIDMYVRVHTMATLAIQRVNLDKSVAEISVLFEPNKFRDDRVVRLGMKDLDGMHRPVTLMTVTRIDFVCGRSQSFADVTRFLDSQTHTDIASKVPRFLKHPHLAALPPPPSDHPYAYVAIRRLNDDILLRVFNCYRLDAGDNWNHRVLWCKLSHICQRWRHLIYECAFHLGMHIRCTNGTPTADVLDHLPTVPLLLDYYSGDTLPEKDELWIYHGLRLHDRVRFIRLRLPPSILDKVVVLMDEHFPILEHLSLFFHFQTTVQQRHPLTLPKAFLAPNLRYLRLPSISPPRRLRLLTSTVSLVTLKLSDIQASSYFRPRLLVARLRSLPQLEELSIEFSTPIPRPSTERELLGEQGAPVTLPSLNKLEFIGVGAYLESLAAQISVPLLEWLEIKLFNQISFVLPHLFYLINITNVFKLSSANVTFYENRVIVCTGDDPTRFHLCVRCTPLDWQIDSAIQICDALIPTLSGVEELSLDLGYKEIPTEMRNGTIDSAAWHDLLGSFIGVKNLHIYDALSEELSHALQVDEVGLDAVFLPNLRSIHARDNRFTSFIDTRQVVGRPVQFETIFEGYVMEDNAYSV